MPSVAQSNQLIRLYEFAVLSSTGRQPVKPDDHSEVVPLLPIPNRTVKRLCADDSTDPRVKVGHRQANSRPKGPIHPIGPFDFGGCALALEILSYLWAAASSQSATAAGQQPFVVWDVVAAIEFNRDLSAYRTA